MKQMLTVDADDSERQHKWCGRTGSVRAGGYAEC